MNLPVLSYDLTDKNGANGTEEADPRLRSVKEYQYR